MPVHGKLGKLPARHDPRTLRLRDYLGALPMPPASKAWDHNIASWGMMLNDRIGCCTIAAVGHAVQLTSANAATEVTIPDTAILAAYSAVSGYNPITGANDNGAVELDVLKYWQQLGVGGHKNAAYASCSLSMLDDVRACIALFGFCYIGFAVPESAMQQFDAGQPWDVVAHDGGIVGGHAVVLVDYDQTGFTAITWGALQRMTVAFFKTYVDEAYGVVLPEWIAANGQSPSNLNLQQLLTDVQQLLQQPTPAPQPAATSTTVSVSPNPVAVGQQATLVAQVTGQQPTGTVQFSVDGVADGSAALDGSGQASTQLSVATAGTHQLSAVYGGDAQNQASTSAAVTLTVQGASPSAQLVQEAQALDHYLGSVDLWDEGQLPGGIAAVIAELEVVEGVLAYWLPIMKAQQAASR